MVNAAAESMFGYRREQLMGQTLELLLPAHLRELHATYRSQYVEAPKARLMGEGLPIIGQRKSGSEFPAEVSFSFIKTSSGLLSVAIITDLTEQRNLEKTLAEKEKALRFSEQQLQNFAGSLLTAQEEERARLAGELHDDLNQRLAVLAIKAAKADAELRDFPAELRGQISAFRATVEELSDDVRRLAQELHPSVLEHFGLARALGSYCEEFAALKNVRI